VAIISALVLLRARVRHAPVDERQPHALDEVPVPVQRLIAIDPALRAAPIRAREKLEARDVAAPASQPAALLADAHPQIRILALHVHTLDVE
jgi:hypothetical protein